MPRWRTCGSRSISPSVATGPKQMSRSASREGAEDTDRRHERPGPDVGDLHARDDGRPARRAREADHAREAQVIDVVPDPVAIGPVLTVAGDRAVDEARILRAQRLVVAPEARRRPGPRAL